MGFLFQTKIFTGPLNDQALEFKVEQQAGKPTHVHAGAPAQVIDMHGVSVNHIQDVNLIRRQAGGLCLFAPFKEFALQPPDAGRPVIPALPARV